MRLRFTSFLFFFSILPITSSHAQKLVVVVRHAERADDSGNAKLSAAGLARAEKLATLLKDAALTAIFTSELDRTVQTAQPTAKQTKLAIQKVDGRKTNELVARLRKEHADGRVLVVGHSNTVPEILAAYGLARPEDIPHGEYDNLWIIYPAPAPASAAVSTTSVHLHF